jgi:probable HAF family extracellular repeat protein
MSMKTHLTLPTCAALSAIALYAGVGARLANAAAGDIYNLGTLGGTRSEGWGINDAGQVAGAAYMIGDTYRAFRYTGTPGSGGAMADLGTLGTGYSLGHGINSSGQVAGTSPAGNNPPRAFRYSDTPGGAGGAMVDLGTLGGTFSNSFGRAINDAGQVAGYGDPAGGSDYHAFRYTGTPGSGGAMADLGTLGGLESHGWGINNAGQVTGWSQRSDGLTRAFLYTGTDSGGTMVALGTLGGLESVGLAINNAGQVTGHSDTAVDPYANRAFRYTPGPGGGMVDLGTPASVGHGINDAGFVVGEAGPAMLWQIDAANTAVNLDAWLDATNPTLGAHWSLSFPGYASDINNNGLVTGLGYYNDGPGGLDDGYRAYILDASSLVGVPEPASLALLALGLPFLVGRNSRRSGTGGARGAHGPMTVLLRL